jgi:excisionase family DNA binding protein
MRGGREFGATPPASYVPPPGHLRAATLSANRPGSYSQGLCWCFPRPARGGGCVGHRCSLELGAENGCLGQQYKLNIITSFSNENSALSVPGSMLRLRRFKRAWAEALTCDLLPCLTKQNVCTIIGVGTGNLPGAEGVAQLAKRIRWIGRCDTPLPRRCPVANCPVCGVEFLSTAEVAERLGVGVSRVRKILQTPGRLSGGKVGQLWLVPKTGVEQFERQPTGVHLPEGPSSVDINRMACPNCGHAIYTPSAAAEFLGRSRSAIYGLLGASNGLQGLKVGSRWIIARAALEAYREAEKAEASDPEEPEGAVAECCSEPGSRLVEQTAEGLASISEGSPLGSAHGGTELTEVQLQVVHVYKPEICNCGAYGFPHRKGGGKCGEKAVLERTEVRCGSLALPASLARLLQVWYSTASSLSEERTEP